MISVRTRRRLQWLANRSAAGPALPLHGVALRPYGASILATALSSLTGWALARWMAIDSVVMVYLVGVVVVAARFGRGPAIVAAVGGSVAFDFFFTKPFYSLRIAEPRLVITVGVMLLVGLVISELTAALRERGRTAVEHARRIAVLYSLTRDLSRATGDAQIYHAARRHVGRAMGCDVFFCRPAESGAPGLEIGQEPSDCGPISIEIADWVFRHQRRAGRGTMQYPDASVTYLPLVAASHWFGVMIVHPRSSDSRLSPTHTRFLGNCARQIAGAMERERLVHAAVASDRAAEQEQLRNSLLASVSHDLRQPLMVIEGAAASLLEGHAAPRHPVYAERVLLLIAEARQMSDTVNKILDMTRLESTAVELDRQWYPLETLVVGALNRVRESVAQHVVVADLPGELLWVYVDGLVFEKLLTNLLENAAKYSEAGTRVTIAAGCSSNAIEIRVSDEGCGLPPGDIEAIFRKFHRGRHRNDVAGIGLGLAICRAIVALHGGNITAQRRPAAGTEFVVRLPLLPGAPAAQEDVEVASSMPLSSAMTS